ncbi:hypothetical protein [Rathayibacter soli]|uniref:hypothetical protein n=1 Tax=Rathayibacter soli TaxID=3144168 RepID=UPI0027E5257A|nr:hypothetical protein [Glaciibacter superstes]
MDRSRIWIIGAIVAMIAVVIFGVLLGVQPQLAAASDANQQQQSIAAQNGAKQAALEQLKTDYKNLPALKSTLAELQKSIPPHADLPAFISDLNALAGATSTTVTGVTVSDAQPYVPPVTAAVPAPGAAGATATPSPSASASAPAAAPKPATPEAPAPVTNAKITGGNFVAVPIKITVSGDYGQALAFMDGLQHGQRLFLVTNFASNGASAAATAAAATAAADAAKSTSKPASGSSDASSPAATPAPSSWTVSGYAYVLLNSAPATK